MDDMLTATELRQKICEKESKNKVQVFEKTKSEEIEEKRLYEEYNKYNLETSEIFNIMLKEIKLAINTTLKFPFNYIPSQEIQILMQDRNYDQLVSNISFKISEKGFNCIIRCDHGQYGSKCTCNPAPIISIESRRDY